MTPSGVAALVRARPRGDGRARRRARQQHRRRRLRRRRRHAGRRRDAVWTRAEMILKVKEPSRTEYRQLRPGLILFTYLHLAANEALTRLLVERRVHAIGYETIQLDDGSLPLLAPMSEVAGRLAVQAGAWCLQATHGGRGVLLSGVAGVRPGNDRDPRRRDRRHERVPGGGRPRRAREHPRRPAGEAALRPRHPRRARHHRHVEPRQHRGGGPRRRSGDRHGAHSRRQGAEAAVAPAGRRACGPAPRWSTSRSIKAGAPRRRVRPRTTTRSTSRRASSTTA